MAFGFRNSSDSVRQYYSTALERSTDRQQEFWTDQQQRPLYPASQQLSGTLKFATAVGAIAAAGYIPTGNGRHVWDYYLSGLRGIEEYSPAKILRTFQTSSIFSPFGSQVRFINKFISPELLTQNAGYAEYLSTLIGEKVGSHTYSRLVSEGVTLKEGRLFWGQTSETALKYASAIAVSPEGGAATIGAAYARRLGVAEGKLKFPDFFKTVSLFGGAVNPTLDSGDVLQVIGGHSRLQDIGRRLGAYGTEGIGRFNRLLDVSSRTSAFRFLTAPLRKLGFNPSLAVKSAGGLEMLGRLSAKYGLGLGALALGYETADWAVRQSSLFDNTLFEEGITYGAATLGVKTHIGAAKLAEFTGLQTYQKKQEEIAPGSTSFQKLLAFPIMGFLGAETAFYGYRVARMAKSQIFDKLNVTIAGKTADEAVKSWANLGSHFDRLGKLLTSQGGLYGRQDWIGRAWRGISRPDQQGELLFKGLGRLTPQKFVGMVGAGLGVAAVLPFLPGALIPSESPEELRRIYSGEQEVPIRRGRWWEMGRSAYEGENIMYFRPHAYALMKARPTERGIWGSDADELSPLTRWAKEQFSYELEQRHYYDRPYPITSPAFSEVPFIGPLLSATIGSWIKPPAVMHESEWRQGQAVKAQPLGFGQRVATEIGQTPGGIPVSATDPTQALGEEIYRVGTEVPGLVGFLGSAIKEKVTGTGDWFDQYSQLESAGRMTSYEREYWDKELGGLAGTSEVWRRLYPHRRRQIDLYNPIENDMPSWMPGPGGRSPDFRHGDPFVRIPYGEARLPGPGYVALHPELEGIDPENYPILEKFKILADVAPYSEEFMSIAAQTRRARKSSDWTQENEADYQETIRQFKAVREKKKFENYQYLSPMGDIFSSEGGGAEQSSSVMAAINEQRKSGQEKPGLFKRLFGGYWELLSHNAETAFDQLTPISPGAKLVHMRTPIESYEREVLYGSASAFWQHPVRDFISPFVRSIGKTLGITEPSGDIQDQRAIESYFDILKYVKYTRLSNLARMSGDTSATKEFEQRKDETLFGVNPFTRNYSSIFRALPRRERDYFTAFEQAGSEEERQTILDMVPENEKALYIARWKLVHADEINRAKKAGILNEKQVQEADIELAGIQREASAEGFETSKSLFAEYLKTRLDGETYPDWYRRTKILANMQSLPGPDWVGWDPSVNLEDIKLKIIQNLGENPIDFNIWPSQSKQLPYKPYIDEEAIEPIVNAEQLSQGDMKERLQTLLSASDMKGDVFISSHDNLGLSEGIEFDIEEDKEIEYQEAIRNAL